MYHAKVFSRRILTTVGQKTTPRQVQQLQGVLNYIRTGRWMKDHSFEPQVRAYNRQDVWTAVTDELGQYQKVLYLEFGVARGDSMRWWSRHLSQPESRLHGFDSFEGLPEEGGPWIKGQFGTGGKPPVIHDRRVQFFQGWFHETLPRYEPPAHEILLINIDADLYSSASYVLRCMRPYIRKGSFIYFDELNQPEHEQRAFDEFLRESRLQFQLIATDWTMAFSLFQCVG
jgi:O-methyltransferase